MVAYNVNSLSASAATVFRVPRRTNAFQKLVATITEHISGEATVTESKLLSDLDTGEDREVDVCIEHEVAGHTIRICIECSSHQRPRDVGWVEQMHGKHLRLPTNLLVLASKSGFTGPALRKAESYRIETAVPGRLPSTFGSEIVGKLDALWVAAMDLTPDKVRFHMEATPDLPAEVVVALPDNVLFRADGRPMAYALGYAKLVTMHLGANVTDMLSSARGDETRFLVEVDPARIPDPDTGENVAIFLQKEEPSGNYLRHITKASITGPANVRIAQVPLTHGELRGTGYSTGSTTLPDGFTVQIVATETSEGERRLTFHHSSHPGSVT
ncbi:hypothetical protein AB0H49_34315 [Nocardia sp. NPDC050713]|uniref:hypothetical protein n=1 Tax=Nocardia sp. NPDC050713 TaxID=3154511 RepID=UPI0033C251FF